MVHKIINNRFRVFVESFFVALIILLVGFFIGFIVESARTSSIMDSYRQNEVDQLNLKLLNYYYQIMDRQTCNLSIQQNLIFADQVYGVGLKLEKYEGSRQLSESLTLEKKRYVLLKTELWLNTLLLKEKCGDYFDTIVYFYSNEPANNVLIAEQEIISNVLRDVKEKRGNTVILLPIAGDLDLDIVSLQRKIYNVTELPSILINEKIILTGFNSPEEIEKYLK